MLSLFSLSLPSLFSSFSFVTLSLSLSSLLFFSLLLSIYITPLYSLLFLFSLLYFTFLNSISFSHSTSFYLSSLFFYCSLSTTSIFSLYFLLLSLYLSLFL